MESVYINVPLALGATFSLIGAGTFAVLAVLAGVFRPERRQLQNIATLTIIPCLALVLGCVAAWFAFQDQTGAVVLLRRVDGGIPLVVTGVGGLLVVVAVAYCIVANGGRSAESGQKLLLYGAGALGLVFVWVVGVAHELTADPAWTTLATPAQMLGCALLGGSALATLIFEKAGALGETSVKKVLVVSAVCGAVLGIGGLAVQLVVAASVSGAGGVGADLVGVSSSQSVVGFFCFVAALLFEVMALRTKETGYHSVIAVICVFVGVFCARLVFYALQVTVAV